MRPRFAATLALAAVAALLSLHRAPAQTPPVVLTDQGPDWTPIKRSDFYARDQGSRMIALAWLRALKQANGQPFLIDSLSRYGYLPNLDNASGLPIGFATSGPVEAQTVGMTCSACHTRQISVDGQAYRIDGGPAIVDFQSLLGDLDAAVGTMLASDAGFASFAAAALGSPSPNAGDASALRRDVEAWYLRFHTLMTRALPSQHPWGPGRLDAVGMIFNRVTGLDLGPPPSFLIGDNIKTADAPVRYPFLWNAARQDKTQWSGFADNGDDILGLGRNVGEVFGVFGAFQPKRAGLVFNFLNDNSVNFAGLGQIENLIKQIGAPKWPWPIDADLSARGEAVYSRSIDQGGCAGCHSEQPGAPRFSLEPTWCTPIQNVGTDTRQFDVLSWQAKTGALRWAYIPVVIAQPLHTVDYALNILKISVIGSIAEHALNGDAFAQGAADEAEAAVIAMRSGQMQLRLPPALRDLEGAFNLPAAAAPESLQRLDMRTASCAGAPAKAAKGAYEARVMRGIWAAAPYLHNGSVPTLAELLKPPAERVSKFKIGSSYDTQNIGLAQEQSQFNFELQTTDCSDLNSGNSRCGHDFGTGLPDDDKKALLEYLKSL